MFVSRFLPNIKIHAWGGLGSQLYALALSIDLDGNFTTREVNIVAHSSGVTRRAPEYAIYSDEIEYKDDFSKSPTRNFHVFNSIKNIVKALLLRIGVYAYCNSDNEVEMLKKWVIIIRGHYTYRTLSFATISKVYSRINNASNLLDSDFMTNSLAIHYRLGDLETLGYKSPIRTERFIDFIKDIVSKNQIEKICVYSDSPETAIKNLKALLPSLNFVQRNLSPIDSVLESSQATFFIGTNSKLSTWIALFRTVSAKSNASYLPMEMKHTLDSNRGELTSSQVTFY